MTFAHQKGRHWRLVAFRAAALIAFLIGVWIVLAILVLPTKTDAAAELKLLGKWGMYLPTSNTALPPERIIEFLPEGQSADYSPELELWGRTSDKPNMKSSWRVHWGVFISTIQNPSVFKGTMVERLPIAWIDNDNFVLTINGPDGIKTPIRYRRISQDEINRIKAGTNRVLDARPQTHDP